MREDPVQSLRRFFAGTGTDPGAPALVAYSGGPDSTALLHALVEAGARDLRAVHVNHGLRPADELEAELALVRSSCASLAVPLCVASIRPGAVEALAREKGSGLEAAARAFRNHVFARLRARTGADIVYFAHTRDDLLETLLMRVLTGSGARGLVGMAPRSGWRARPFLDLPKADLLAWLEAKGLGWSTDSSNSGDAFLRNRLRHHVLPALDSALPGWRGGLLETARKAALEDEALESQAAAFAFSARPGKPGLEAPEGLLRAPRAIARRSFLEGASNLLGGRRLSSRLADAAMDALASGAKGYSGGGLVLSRGEGCLELVSGLDFPGPDGYFVTIAGPVEAPLALRVGAVRLVMEWREGIAEGLEGPGSVRADAFRFPVIVRSRRPGDALAIKQGRKSVDELLSEMGVAVADRDRVPLVEDRDGLVAVLASGFGGRDRFRPSEARATGSYLSVTVKGA